MKPKSIYLVIGETGEFGGKRWWPVAAYLKEKDCLIHVEMANEVVDDFYRKHKRGGLDEIAEVMIGKCRNPYDPNIQMDYNGTRYSMRKSELFNSFVG